MHVSISDTTRRSPLSAPHANCTVIAHRGHMDNMDTNRSMDYKGMMVDTGEIEDVLEYYFDTHMCDEPNTCKLPNISGEREVCVHLYGLEMAWQRLNDRILESFQLIKTMSVRNMTSTRWNSNREVPNQFIITAYDAEGNMYEYFQSYRSVIAKRDLRGNVWLDERYWDYSTTTGKYRNEFLGENIEETRKKIKSGAYVLTNLN